MRTPALPICLALVAGIAIPAPASPLYTLAIASVALVSALRARAATMCIIVAFAALGSAARTLHTHAVEQSELRRVLDRYGDAAFSSPLLVEGRVRDLPEHRSDRTVLGVDVDRVVIRRKEAVCAGGLRVSVRGEPRHTLEHAGPGDHVRLWASVREPRFFANPGSFDGARRLELEHVDFFGSVKSGLLVTVVERSTSLRGWISRGRRIVLRRMSAELDGRDYAVVAALVTGIRTELDPELVTLYQRAGIFHVMAISGAHVGIWIAFLYAAARRLGCGTRTTLLVLVALLPLYALFCGGRAPVVRAVVMALVLIGARLSSLRAPSENALALAALMLLAWEPANLFDAGFQLTMAAMATICTFYEPIAERLTPLGFLAKPLAVSFAAQLGVIPIAAWHFHRLSLASPITSIVAIPLAAVICVLGVVLVIVSGIPIIASAVSVMTSFAVTTLTGLAQIASALPVASIRVGAPPFWALIAYGLGVLALLSASKRIRAAGAMALSVLFVSSFVPRHASPGVLELNALDVGHGDAIVISLPDGGTVLIDGGGLPMSSLDVGESVVLPFLLDRGVRHLDAVVVSHGDYDHIGGLATIVSEMGVDAIWHGRLDRNRYAYRVLQERARERGVPSRTLTAGEQFDLGGARFEVLAAGESETPNNRSLVLRVSYGGRSVLLTGDAEEELERRLVSSGIDLHADVLKIAHHGSKSSSSEIFLDAIRPEVAVISARENRSRPIPSPIVLSRLRERGIEYARTDIGGMVTVRIRSDGALELSTYLE